MAVILAAVAGMWLFDGELLRSRMGVALGAGAITALGCAINLYTIMPQMEGAFVRWTTLRVIVDNMREVLPRGSVVFCEDNLLNQLDCVGGWKLYNNALVYAGDVFAIEGRRWISMTIRGIGRIRIRIRCSFSGRGFIWSCWGRHRR